MENVFLGRLGLQQRVLPAYRAPFLDALASACQGGLSVFAGQALPEENVSPSDHLEVACFVGAQNRNFFPISSPFYQCWQSGLLRWLEDWQPDALVVEANTRYRSTPFAVRKMHGLGRPVVAWGLGAPPLTGPLARLRERGRRRFLLSFDALIAYSQRGADEYRRLGFPPERVFVAPNAATPRPTQPPPVRPGSFDGRPVVLFVGRLQARKRLETLLHACAALPAAIQPRLWVVGDGPARMQFQSVAEAVYPQAEFIGACHGPDLEPYFATADLFVLPGTGGLAVQQAMAYGLPVIVAEGDGTQADLVRPWGGPQEANGWLAPPGNLPALVEALQAALSDPARLRAMGAVSYRIVAGQFNLESMVEVFVQALNTVVRS